MEERHIVYGKCEECRMREAAKSAPVSFGRVAVVMFNLILFIALLSGLGWAAFKIIKAIV